MANKKIASLTEVRSREFLGHPAGLWALFTTEMWERFCYYGMRALLVLYLISTLTDSNPGFGWSEESANKLYGWFTSLVYLFPLLGGFVADRFLGQHRSVILGGSLMAAGEFLLFYSEYFRQGAVTAITPESAPLAFWCFILGLFLITLGNGFFKPCISVMVGELYEKNDPRRDSAFNIFYMGINVGALMAPFVAGSIGEKISWHWGFLTACIGMIFGLTTYTLLSPKYLGPIGTHNKKPQPSDDEVEKIDAESDTAKIVENAKPRLTKVEIDRIAVILTLTFFCIAFWSVFEQAGTSLNIFAKKETNRQVPAAVGQTIPGFLPNQDELDAKIATNELHGELFDLITAVESFDADVEAISTELKEAIFAQNFDDACARVEEFKEQLNPESYENFIIAMEQIQATFNSASFSLNKANAARKKAGLEPLDLHVEALAEAYEQAKNEEAKFAVIFAERLEKKLAEFEAIDEAAIKTLEEAVEKDLRKELQAEFLANEKNNIDKDTAIYTFPVTWYQSVNPLGVVIFAPLFNLLWGFLRRFKLEPSTPVKFGVGLVLLSIAFMFMIGGAMQSVHTNGNAGAYWLVFCYLFCTWGELCLSPVGLSMVSRLAPERFASLLMGIWFLSSAIAGYLSGYLAAVLGSGDHVVSFWLSKNGGLADFFLILTLAPMIAGVIVFMIAPRLRKMMHENE